MNPVERDLVKQGTELNKSVIDTDESNCDKWIQQSTQNDMTLRRSERIKVLPKTSYEEVQYYLLTAQSVTGTLPKTYHDLHDRDDKKQWEAAIKEELKSLEDNNTCSLVQKPENKNIVNCK